jgi:hypothetical protein
MRKLQSVSAPAAGVTVTLESDQSHYYIPGPRTDEMAYQLYENLGNGKYSEWDLHRLGYQASQLPFSIEYPFNGILDSVVPDLLHGISKCFMDYLIGKWIFPLMDKTRDKGVNIDALKTEIDARFAIMPKYSGLRRFSNGVLSQKHHWSVYEYKAMMQVIVGVLTGLCPPKAFPLVTEYLHIHYIAHYTCHTEESLEWLDSAVTSFFNILHDPNGPFVKHKLVSPHYFPQRIHYFSHYAESVRERGSLPSFSTQMTEIHHKPLKQAYRRSNKRPQDSIKYMLDDISQKAAFSKMIDRVRNCALVMALISR